MYTKKFIALCFMSAALSLNNIYSHSFVSRAQNDTIKAEAFHSDDDVYPGN